MSGVLAAYLDNAATTPVLPEVAAAMLAVLGAEAGGPEPGGAFANPSAVHRWGLGAAESVADARRAVAGALGAAESEIVFTSGGTESNHLALLGLARARARKGRHVITTGAEHRSVLAACDALAADGWAVSRLGVGSDGRLEPRTLAAAVRPDTTLCALAHVNNETGAVQPLEALAAVLRSAGDVALHVDGVQALGKVPTPYAAWGVCTAALSAHKIGGPKGTGALYLRRGARLVPAVAGEQEAGLRPGTENVPGIVGFGAAVRAVSGWTPRLFAAKLALLEGLCRRLPELEVNGPDPRDPAAAAPHILNLSFARAAPVPAEVLLHALEARGVACSAGSACTARRPEPSHVLAALGLPPERQRRSLRFSVGPRTTHAEIAHAVEAIPAAVAELARAEARR